MLKFQKFHESISWLYRAETAVEDRVDIYSHKDPYITIKDHKSSYPARIETRLVNPAKSQIGRVAKKILDNIIKLVKPKIDVRQWKATSEVINWFESIGDKQRNLM